MNMLIVGLPFGLPGSDGLAATLEADADEVGAGGFAEAAATETGFRAPSGATLTETGICGTREVLGDGLSVLTAPMVRAVVEAASSVAFSRICRCLSSSLAKIGTRSSGMGLLSYTMSCGL